MATLSSQNYELHEQREEPQVDDSLHGGRIRAETGRTSLQGEPKEKQPRAQPEETNNKRAPRTKDRHLVRGKIGGAKT
jgi:hypothetical protein